MIDLKKNTNFVVESLAFFFLNQTSQLAHFQTQLVRVNWRLKLQEYKFSFTHVIRFMWFVSKKKKKPLAGKLVLFRRAFFCPKQCPSSWSESRLHCTSAFASRAPAWPHRSSQILFFKELDYKLEIISLPDWLKFYTLWNDS